MNANTNPSISQAQLYANRANAQHSTGPRSDAAKARVSLNAVKTGLTGCTVLLPSDDAALYQQHLADYENEFKPVGTRERHLVQSIADTCWRLNRVPGLEMAIFSKGRIQFADKFSDRPEHERLSLIDLETLLVYERQIRNLQLQDARLARRREKEIAELQLLQNDRRVLEARAKHDARQATVAQNGIEFAKPPVAPTATPVGSQKATQTTPAGGPETRKAIA